MLLLNVRALSCGDGEDDECKATDDIEEQHPENDHRDDLVSRQVHLVGDFREHTVKCKYHRSRGLRSHPTNNIRSSAEKIAIQPLFGKKMHYQ